MGHPRVTILGVQIARMGLGQALDRCEQALAAKTGGTIFFVNVHSIIESQSQIELKTALNSSFISAADGVPLLWSACLKRKPIPSRVCGPDFMAELLVSQKDAVHGFIGGKPGIADRISTRYGVRSILYSPPMRGFSPQNAHEDWENFLALCLDRKPPQIIWVGLGAPKQELWIQEISKRAPEVLFFGVGAAFDFLAGAQDRAPHWMQKFGLEWVHRLFQDPRRLWRRYLSTNFKFLMKVSTEILCEACIRSIE